MRHEDWTQLNDAVIRSTTEVLTSNGIAVEYESGGVSADVPWADTLAIIGLGGQKLRGSVVLGIPESLLRISHPAAGSEPEELADWLAELANLLLGRLKAQLLARGVSIELGTPVTISGTALRFHRFKGLPMVHGFRVGHERIHVVFEAIGEEATQLSASSDADVALEAGEVVLF